MLGYIITALLLATFTAVAPDRRMARCPAALFYAVQAAFFIGTVTYHAGETVAQFFTFDGLGLLFFGLMTVIAPAAFYAGNRYLDRETLRQYKLYNISMMLLCVSIAGVYFANHLAVTWIFLEATTLCTAGLVYHRRSTRSLEATWKYIFVCSTGIAIAYLGILLLSTVAEGGDLSYATLRETVASGNPLFVKLAFLFIVVGYSCKLEIFPLYTIGIDANYAAPAPASALISTALVNAGFVAVLRVYRVVEASPVFAWACHVLVAAGVLSLLVGALYLRRTNHYKRLLAYSTVENMGLATLMLGLGSGAAWAAVLHAAGHALLKSGLFIQTAQVGKAYGSYRINRLGDYMRVNRAGAVALLLGVLGLTAFPPSVLFISELALFRELFGQHIWWLAIVVVLLVCVVMYSLWGRLARLCYKPGGHPADRAAISPAATWVGFVLILLALAAGVCLPQSVFELLTAITAG
ncbi:MAG: hydrogenase 4 subunit F [Rikenellaceae bacterium]|nr:hydrogenase 4 subunit F [Rikenellaceae bacterium]